MEGDGIMVCIVPVICIVVTFCMAFYVKRILDTIEEMLNKAYTGEFMEEHYDERRLSRIEYKMECFLSSNTLSKRKLQKEREVIQSTISDISHQTKTPVTNIILYAQLLRELTEDEEQVKLASQILNQAGRLNFLVQSFIKVSHLETGIVKVNPSIQPVSYLLKFLYDTYNERALQEGITMSVCTSGEKAFYDLKWTKEAAGNIVDNAIKYTSYGGNIKIYIRNFEIFLAIVVEDSGIGIPEEEQASVFKRFYRGYRVGQDDGTGIGLYLAREIVLMEDGYIKVQSEPGRGSKFSIYLKKS